MKIAKTFRLSEEAAAVLEASNNATQLIESLLLDNLQAQRPLQVVPYQQVEDLFKQYLNGLSSNGRTADFDSVNLGSSPSEPATPEELQPVSNTPAELIGMIRELEQDRDEQLEYCQDPDRARELVNRYKTDIDILWAEYNLLKKVQNEKG